MGAQISVNTITRSITNQIQTNLQNNAGASSQATCIVDIKSVNIGKVENCQIGFTNFCSSQAEASIDTTIAAIIDEITKLSNEQKQQLAVWFTLSVGVSTDVANLNNTITTYLTDKCKTQANLNNEVRIETVNIGQCIGDKNNPSVITFNNTGQAAANCVISVVLKVATDTLNSLSANQTQGVDLATWIWPIAIAIIIITAIYAVVKVLTALSLSPNQQVDLQLAKNNAYSAHIKSLRN